MVLVCAVDCLCEVIWNRLQQVLFELLVPFLVCMGHSHDIVLYCVMFVLMTEADVCACGAGQD